ncbi:MAG: hypothetical protein JXR58_01780, partial [Bacteroidales bacterium]|nr:hypothetical protein [Bacteroidales bacterium]
MENLIIRSVTGLFFAGIIIASIAFSSASLFLVFLALLIAGMIEFYNISSRTRSRPQKISGIAIGVILYTFSFLYSIGIIEIQYFLIFIPFCILIYINEIYQDSKRPIQNLAVTFM